MHRKGGINYSLGRSCLILFFVVLSFFALQGCSVVIPNNRLQKESAAKQKVVKRRIVKKRSKTAKTRKVKLLWPVRGKITSKFGMRGNGRHEGLDIAAPKGTRIVAAGSGKVIFSGWGPRGYGKIVMIKHSSKYVTVYAHNHKNAVSTGDVVKRGDLIAYVGKTGRTRGYHLHFEVRVNLIPRDPLLYLSRLR